MLKSMVQATSAILTGQYMLLLHYFLSLSLSIWSINEGPIQNYIERRDPSTTILCGNCILHLWVTLIKFTLSVFNVFLLLLLLLSLYFYKWCGDVEDVVHHRTQNR